MIRDLKTVAHRACDTIGARYKHLGRGPRDFDCFGLFFHAYAIDERDTPTYARFRQCSEGYYADPRWHRKPTDTLFETLASVQRELSGTFVTTRRPDPGALVLMRVKLKDARVPFDHVGIIGTRDGQVVHADLREGVVTTYYNALQDRIVDLLIPR